MSINNQSKIKIFIIPPPTRGDNFYWHCPRGEKIVTDGLNFIPEVELVNKYRDADFYLLDYVPHENGAKTRNFIERFEGDKLVVIDWTDEPDQLLTDKYFKYFKRSMVKGDENRFIAEKKQCWDGKDILPFAYAALDEFNYTYDDTKLWLQRSPVAYQNRVAIDIGCFLRATCVNRSTVLDYSKHIIGKLLEQSNELKYFVGPVDQDSRSVGSKCHFNKNYYKYLANTKINITCNPSGWEGDSRLWESLANGCLTFVDRMFVDYPDKLEDGKHVIYYDLHKPYEMFDKIVYYLNNPTEAAIIANRGLEFAFRYHSPKARMTYVINHLK